MAAAAGAGAASEAGGKEEDVLEVAPAGLVTALLKELLELVRESKSEAALLTCKKILRWEPSNSLAKRYEAVLRKATEDGAGSDSSSEEEEEEEEEEGRVADGKAAHK